MPDQRFAWTKDTDPVTTFGSMGSGANDAWQIVSRFPLSELTQGVSKRLAIFVKGGVCEFQNFGTTPNTGMMQVCLGDATSSSAGLRGTTHRMTLPLLAGLGAYPNSDPNAAHGFSFLAMQQADPALSDPDFTAVIDTTTGADLVLWARAIWNDDAMSYTTLFTVRDVQWLVLDMDVLEAASIVRAVESLDVTLDNTVSTYKLLSSDSASLVASQQWMQLSSIYCQPRHVPDGINSTQRRPYFTSGTNDTASSNTTIGNHTSQSEQGVGVFTLNALNSSRGSQLRFCSSAVGIIDVPVGNHYAQVLGAARDFGAVPDKVTRSAQLLLRLDSLEHFTRATVTATMTGVVASNNTASAYYGISLSNNASTVFGTSPILIGTADALRNGSPVSRKLMNRLRSSTGGVLHQPDAFHKLYGANQDGERHPQTVLMTVKNVPGVSASYLLDVFDNIGPAQPGDARFPQFFMFHPILFVEDVLTPPWQEQGTTQITLTAEGPLVGSMNALPIAPDVQVQQTMDSIQRGEVLGAQGYKRTWPTWIKPRRSWQLQWSGLSPADALTLRTFLDVNDSFALTPQGSSVAIPATITSEVQRSIRPDAIEVIQVQVVELLFTA